MTREEEPRLRLRMGATTARRRTFRVQQTDAEKRLWFFLRARQPEGYKFRRQHSIGPYVLDFYCVEAGLAIELDGSQHLDAGGVERDAARSVWLAERGIRVLRYSDRDALIDPQAVIAAVIAALPPKSR